MPGSCDWVRSDGIYWLFRKAHSHSHVSAMFFFEAPGSNCLNRNNILVYVSKLSFWPQLTLPNSGGQ